MTAPRDPWPQLNPIEETFVRRLQEQYAPRPLTPTRRVLLDEALWARLQPPSRRKFLAPAMGLVTMAVVVVMLTWSGMVIPQREHGVHHRSTTALLSAGQWEYALLYPRELLGTVERDDKAMLPDEYAVIARVFLDE